MALIKCYADCINRDVRGWCGLDEVYINDDGECDDYEEEPEEEEEWLLQKVLS